MEKQIEEMAKVIHDSDIADINTFPISMSECLARHGARRTGAAMALFKADYRKQSEGEWIDKPTGAYSRMQSWCSACGKHSGIGGIESNRHKPYCPNCGAKMKGGGKE